MASIEFDVVHYGTAGFVGRQTCGPAPKAVPRQPAGKRLKR